VLIKVLKIHTMNGSSRHQPTFRTSIVIMARSFDGVQNAMEDRVSGHPLMTLLHIWMAFVKREADLLTTHVTNAPGILVATLLYRPKQTVINRAHLREINKRLI
jgi:hypothetical protein